MAQPQQQKAGTGARGTLGERPGVEEPRARTQKAGAQDMTRCIEACLEVVRAATQCATHCIANNERGERQHTILLCLDAADVAAATAKVAARDPVHVPALAQACAEVCQATAAACDEMGGHEVVEDCAEVCRRCAGACQDVVADL